MVVYPTYCEAHFNSIKVRLKLERIAAALEVEPISIP